MKTISKKLAKSIPELQFIDGVYVEKKERKFCQPLEHMEVFTPIGSYWPPGLHKEYGIFTCKDLA